MQAIKKKLNSQRGASLTFALLIFLVCAVVGSVVLAAGTASSGRLAELSGYEQRYHAVNSAAELLAKEICSGKATIECTKIATTTIVQTFDGDFQLVSEDRQEPGAVDYESPVVTITADNSLFHGNTEQLMRTLANKVIGAGRSNAEIWNNLPPDPEPVQYTITADGDKDHLKTEAKATMSIIPMDEAGEQYIGELDLQIKSTGSGNLTYSVLLVFKTDPINRKSFSLPVETTLLEQQENESGRTDTLQETKTEYKNLIVRWNLLNMTVGG